MENNELRDSQADEGGLLPFGSATLESKLLRRVPAPKRPSRRKKTLAAGPRKRSVRLKKAQNRSRPAAAAATKGNGGQAPETRKTPATGGEGEPDKARRPITLKADLALTEWDPPTPDKAPARKPARAKGKTARTGARKPATAAKARAESGAPKLTRTRKRQADQGPRGDTARSKDKTPPPPPRSGEGPTAPATEIRHQTLSELWASWPPAWRRTLISVGLSFLAGILFHALFVSGEPPASGPQTSPPGQQKKTVTPAPQHAPPVRSSEQQAAPEPYRQPSGDEFYWGPTIHSPRTTHGPSPRQYPPMSEPAPRAGAGYGRGYGAEREYGYGYTPAPYTPPVAPYTPPVAPYTAPLAPYTAPVAPYTTTPAAPPRYESRARGREQQQPRRRYNPWAYESEGPQYPGYR